MSATPVDKHPVAGQPGPPAVKKSGSGGRHLRFPHLLRFMITAAIPLIFLLAIGAGYVQKGLWMQQLDYAGIFWRLLSIRWTMFCAAFVLAFSSCGCRVLCLSPALL